MAIDDDSSDSDDIPLAQLMKRPKKSGSEKKEVKKEVKKEKKEAKKAKKEVKKETKKESKKEVKKESKKDVKKEKKGETPTKKAKKEEVPVYKWWLEPPLPEGVKWKSLHHNGVLFPPPYQPHGVPMMYDGEPIVLSPPSEEVASFYAIHLDNQHTQKPTFNKNFFDSFRSVMSAEERKKITKFRKCSFRSIQRHLAEKSEARRNRSKEEKAAEKAEKDKLVERYGWAMVDGQKQKVGNYNIEPPGLFLGRGDHPRTGTLKRRVQPEDVVLNMSKDAVMPPCPVEGHHWGDRICDPTLSWLASWTENVNGAKKYVHLAASSRVKGEADRAKFDKSRDLCSRIETIRKTYEAALSADDMMSRQLATAVWVIDRLALRVGNEKGEDEADTVGCCSLRVEHVRVEAPNLLHFDFLGKDSMRYENTVTVSNPQVWKNFQAMVKDKAKDDDVFDAIKSQTLNDYLRGMMPGLSAKVFRTFNASYTLEKELPWTFPSSATVAEKVLAYNRANREVAILCNHQRSVPPSHGDAMEKLKVKIAWYKKQAKWLRKVANGTPDTPSEFPHWEEGKNPVKAPKSTDAANKRLATVRATAARLGVQATQKDELKTVALTTSKINYMDPRITYVWCKTVGVPIEKIYTKTLREKFPWADEEEGWRYDKA